MKKILFFLLLLGLKGQGQSGYIRQYLKPWWIANISDSGLHVPRYATTPTVRGGVFNGAGNIGVDTVNHRFYFYSGGSWRYSNAGTSGGTPTWQQVLTAGSTLTTDNTIDIEGNELIFSNGGTIELSTVNGVTSSTIIESTGSSIVLQVSGSAANYNSVININTDSIKLFPHLGRLSIDTLLNRSNQNALMGWDSTGTDRGQVGYVTLGSGLSLSSGVLNTSGTVPTPISSLTAATGTNSISNGNYTQTWNWPTLTSGALLINAASTAMTNSSYVFGITNSGANASSGITSYSADIYNTHTGTTSTNVALRLNASGGTVNNALDIGSGALTIGGSAGTSGQVLTSGGANALPTWTTPSSGGTPGGSDTYIQFNDGGSFGGDAGFTYNKTTNVFSTNNGAYRPTGTISFSDAGAGSVYRSSSDGLVFRAVTGSGYDLLMYDAVGNAVFGLEAGTSKLGSSTQIGAGLLGYGSWNAWMNLRGGTTTNASLTIRDGVAPSSPAEGQIWRTTDKVYNVIQTGAATKEFTLNDIALTSGRIPYTTTNGRLTDTATFLRSPGGSVSIGTSSPSASALLDVSSTTKGALMPRMTTTQRDAISSPATGLELFNTTTNTKQIYDGTRWVEAAHPLYKVYTALLTQSGTSAPTATVLENTLGGTVVWSYNSAGDYTATLSGAFTSNKTWLMCNAGQTVDTYAGNFVIAELNLIDVNSVRVITSTGGSGADDELLNTSIEIRVYY